MNRIAAIALASMTLSAPAWGQDFLSRLQNSAWQIDTGFDYSSGRYGAASKTDVLSIPLEGKVQLDSFRLEASLPYLDVKGPGIVADGVVVGNGAVRTHTGIGDLNMGAAYLLTQDGAFPAIEMEGIVKVPTAETGLGTGKTDFTLQANIAHSLTTNFMLFGSIGYQWLSDFSTFALKDGLQISAGANYALSDRTSIGASASYRQEYLKGLGEVFTISPYALWTIADHWRISGYGTLGSGKASPEYGFGARLIYFRS